MIAIRLAVAFAKCGSTAADLSWCEEGDVLQREIRYVRWLYAIIRYIPPELSSYHRDPSCFIRITRRNQLGNANYCSGAWFLQIFSQVMTPSR